MATNKNTLFWPRGFSKPTSADLPNPPLSWSPTGGWLGLSLTIEGMAADLQSRDPVTYTTRRLAHMTANDMRYAFNVIMNYKQ